MTEPVYLHCSQCVREQWKPKIEVLLDEHKLIVWCKRHNRVVVSFTPESLRQFIDSNPGCALCRAGVPHEHHAATDH